MKMYDKVCAVCGKNFQSNKPHIKLCSKECNCKLRQACAKNRAEAKIKGRIKKQIVKIKIIDQIDVFDNMRPEVGNIYEAEKTEISRFLPTPLYIIRSIGKHGLIIRASECVEVV